jgi:hypothetical protein
MTPFDNVIPAIAKCEGYTVNRILMSVIEASDSLEIGFRWGPGRPDVTLSLQGIYYFALGRSAGADLLYVDKITATPLPAGGPWPGDVPFRDARTPDLPAVLWIRAEPLQLEVVAAIVSVFEEVR